MYKCVCILFKHDQEYGGFGETEIEKVNVESQLEVVWERRNTVAQSKNGERKEKGANERATKVSALHWNCVFYQNRLGTTMRTQNTTSNTNALFCLFFFIFHLLLCVDCTSRITEKEREQKVRERKPKWSNKRTIHTRDTYEKMIYFMYAWSVSIIIINAR